MKPDCIVHWTLVWTVHPEDLGIQGPRAIKLQIAIVHWTLVGIVCPKTLGSKDWELSKTSFSNCTFHFKSESCPGCCYSLEHSRFWVKILDLKASWFISSSIRRILIGCNKMTQHPLPTISARNRVSSSVFHFLKFGITDSKTDF